MTIDNIPPLSFRDRAIRAFKRFGESLQISKTSQEDEEQERLIISKKQFEEYERGFFGRLQKIQNILELLVKDKQTQLRTSIEEDIENQGKKQSRPTISTGNLEREDSNQPLSLTSGAIAGAVVGLITRVRDIQKYLEDFNEWVRNSFESIVEFLNELGPNLATSIGAGATSAIVGPVASLIRPHNRLPESERSITPEAPTPDRSANPTTFPLSSGGTPERNSVRNGRVNRDVRRNPRRNSLQNRMADHAQNLGYTVTSIHRSGDNAGAGGHEAGFAIDLRPRAGQGQWASRDELIDLWTNFRSRFGMPTDVLFEPEPHPHIHIEIDPNRAHDIIRYGNVDLRRPSIPTAPIIQEPEQVEDNWYERLNSTEPVGESNSSIIPTSLAIDSDQLDPNVKEIMIQQPPQTYTENQIIGNVGRSEPAPKHVYLEVRNPFDGIAKIRREASVEGNEV